MALYVFALSSIGLSTPAMEQCDIPLKRLCALNSVLNEEYLQDNLRMVLEEHENAETARPCCP